MSQPGYWPGERRPLLAQPGCAMRIYSKRNTDKQLYASHGLTVLPPSLALPPSLPLSHTLTLAGIRADAQPPGWSSSHQLLWSNKPKLRMEACASLCKTTLGAYSWHRCFSIKGKQGRKRGESGRDCKSTQVSFFFWRMKLLIQSAITQRWVFKAPSLCLFPHREGLSHKKCFKFIMMEQWHVSF